MNVEEATRICLGEITGKFEGGKWDKVSDNFDGYGPSIGIIQFSFGTGSLQPLIKKVSEYEDMNNFFTKENIKELFEVMRLSVSEQKKYANEFWFSGRKWKRQDLQIGFLAMAKSKGFREAQLEGAKKYERKALKLFNSYIPGNSLREYAIFFDLAVQNGGVRISTQNEIELLNSQTKKTLGRKMTDKELLRNWIKVRSSKSNERWQEDVMTRKMAILNDGGLVHGEKFDFSGLCLDREVFVS